MDPSDKEEADRIRAKRLAKLGGTPSAQPSPSTTAASQTDGTAGSLPPPSSAAPISQSNPQATTEKKPVKINVSKPRPSSPSKRDRDGSEKPRDNGTTRPRANKPERAAESVEVWQDRILKQAMRVTLSPEEVVDSNGNKLAFLASTRQDLEDQNAPILLNVEVLESAITEAAAQAEDKNIFKYLLTCFKRVSRTIRSTRYTDENDPRHDILKEARRLCMSYCVFAITMPEMFGEDVATSNGLADHLLAEPESDYGICADFLTQASILIEEDDSIKDALTGAVEQLSTQLADIDMLQGYEPYVRALRNIFQYPKLIDAISQSSMWAPSDVQAQDIEKKTILGPFFRISPMQQEPANSYFPAPKSQSRGDIASAQNAVRMSLRNHQDNLFVLTNAVVKSGPAPRERILDWFAMCVNKNHKKRAMRVDPRTVSSDGFMVNVTNALDRLSEPFMDATFSKIEKIDVDYLRRNPRVDISEETKMNVDQKSSDEFYSNNADGKNNFISEVFFLTVAAHHYGTEAAQSRADLMKKSVKRSEEDVKSFEAERHKYINDPRYLQRYEEHLEKMKKMIDNTWSTIHATNGVLQDEQTQSRSMQFMRYVIVWLLRLASGQNLPKNSIQLPLPEEQPLVFKCLPEYFLEDVVDNFKYIFNNVPMIVTPQQSSEVVEVCVTFLQSSDYVKNPSIKSGLVTILYYGIMPYTSNRKLGVLGDALIGSSFANKHLLHALMRYYIEAENTGTHTQFFDKFNIRYEIFQVIKRIWVNTVYRENLAKEAKVNTEFFVQFVNMITNDATFVLDESLTSLQKIHELSKELNDSAHMQGLSEDQRKEKQELLDDSKSKAKSYMGLTRETMETLILFTEALASSFAMKEIVTRLADMLDMNLALMVGPKSSNLKVDEPDKYDFHPKALLSDIVKVYTNLSKQQNFITAIARDERSYIPSNFDRAMNIMKDKALKSPDELKLWEQLCKDVAEAKAQDEQEEEDLGEIPDEFLDPLMATLMTDPVILPMSKNTIDRATIQSHLLSTPMDPFNRSPLKIGDVIPDVELKAKIDAWKAEKKAERQRERMDVSEG
ncbi:related to ubiquitin fusion degradation protein-2 [Ramularia collo-cygni]|uniref:Related to ubiquitin fusion degradation protein-2 n=1 Tax=Ramularia collo-cygni TaxID=112498 RepID=A0A2D3VNV3_9PEZI|nr:related to ubiquitin fusion degradation protein-2 [Ramularia collo-cygni]CZT24654.1 related to ubiquitin fusion degradation protein-2 [Ramularia collo-cygni]